jgi:hypothetical protein
MSPMYHGAAIVFARVEMGKYDHYIDQWSMYSTLQN